nr:MAG TPA: Herpesvirus UL41A [Caudoviricetes sp.]
MGGYWAAFGPLFLCLFGSILGLFWVRRDIRGDS